MASSSVTEKTKCPKCQKYISENCNSICCDKCNHWFHLHCSRLKLLRDFKTFVENPNQSFVCKFCLNYKCGKCDKPVFEYQNAMCCDLCSLWHHLKCSKINLAEYQKISKSNES